MRVMGLETVGFAAANRDYLCVDPVDIQSPLEEMVHVLESRRIGVALFNMQHCVLPRSLWKHSRRSISDWKNEFLPVCDGCTQRGACAGFFALTSTRPSRAISPIRS